MMTGRVLLALVFSLVLGTCGTESGPEDDRPGPVADAPNIVFVLLDDATKAQYTKETMPFTWRYMRQNATTFTDYIVTSPLCCPARASIITGQYGHNSGVLANSYGAIDDPRNVLPVWLQRAGYRTAHVGKFLNNFEQTLDDPADPTPGWDEWFTQLEPQRYFDYEISDNGEPRAYGDRDEDYLTRVLNAKAADLIDEFADRGETFYLELDAFAPHFAGGQKGRCRGAAQPDPLDEGSFSDARVERSPALFEAHREDKPGFIQRLPVGSPTELRAKDDRYACALESLRAVDRGVEEIVSRLRERGLLDSTALVFSSDNGVFYGEHGIPDEKQFPYREAYEVPLQIALPDSLGGPTLAENAAPVASIDLAPTLLEMAAAEPCRAPAICRPLDGRSLIPLLESESATQPGDGRPRGIELTLTQNNEPYDRVCEYFGVRSGRWAYIEHVTVARRGRSCRPSEETELYDLDADPRQLLSLAGKRPAVEQRLRRLALSVRACEGASCRRLGRGG
ncbi:MAG: sulfatase [Actinomycetota bacterium]|nr:sulfatase [Actinomycetota bacterium]